MKKRNSNVEILRIISMIMIVLSHYSVHNGINKSSLQLGFNRYLLEISILGNIGVIIFILINGYYLIKQKEPFQIKKFVLLILETFFYSSIIYSTFVILGLEHLSFKSIIKNIFPIAFKQYWFMTAYLLLYIFTPYINKLLISLNKKEHLNFIVFSLLIFSVLPMITTQDFYGNELIQFIYIYSIGAFIGKYHEDILKYKKLNVVALISLTFILLLSVLMFDLIGLKVAFFSNHSTYFFKRTSIIALLFSTSLFIVFISKKSCSNDFVNNIASLVLGVYLISDNNYIRHELWTNLLKIKDYVSSPFLIIHMLVSVLIVFVVCIIIDFIRKSILEKLASKIYDKIVTINNK